MSLFIQKVRIKNFRSLKNVEVELSPNITLLVGANNAGKTTFLRALNIALNFDRKFISQDDLFIDKEGNGLPDDEKIITIDVKIVPEGGQGEFNHMWSTRFGNDNKPGAQGDVLAFRTKIDFTNFSQEAQINRYVITNWDNGIVDENDKLTADLSGIPFHFMDAQRDLQEDLQLRTSNFGRLSSKIKYDAGKREEIEQLLQNLNQEAVQSSDVLKSLKKHLEELNQTVQAKGRGVEITPFPKKVRDLHKGMKVHFQDGGSDTFSIEYHGMGTRSWASLLTFKAKIAWEEQEKQDENLPFHPVLGLEEPEAHLHPNAQRQVYQQLFEIKGQKIVSTHSPYIVAQAKLGELRHFQKETDETLVNKIDTTDLTSDDIRKITKEIMLSRGEILFSKAIVLFEGETEALSFPIFATKYWGTFPFVMGVNLLKVDGNGFKPYILLAESLRIPWFIFSDYDQQNIRRGVDNVLSHFGLDSANEYPNVIKLGKSIENYLVEEERYQVELKTGINSWLSHANPVADIRYLEAENRTTNEFTDQQLITLLASRDGKVRYPSFWANEMIKLDSDRAIPPRIRDLFDAVNAKLFPAEPQPEENANPQP